MDSKTENTELIYVGFVKVLKQLYTLKLELLIILQGGRDVAYFTRGHIMKLLFQTDYAFFEVANLTGSQNCTLELDSSWLIDAR